MDESREYAEHGAICIRELFSPELAQAVTYQMSRQVARFGEKMLAPPVVGNKRCYEAYCYQFPVLLTLLWGLTPRIEQATGANLLPTYSYFRTYQHGDLCRVHCDRPACEHSVSLTLGYSDDHEWALEVGRDIVPEDQRASRRGADDFGDAPFMRFSMRPGDAVVYRGVEHLHGRTRPNPNGWSAHLFLHWVDRNGPHADCAFDGKPVSGASDFRFPAEPEATSV